MAHSVVVTLRGKLIVRCGKSTIYFDNFPNQTKKCLPQFKSINQATVSAFEWLNSWIFASFLPAADPPLATAAIHHCPAESGCIIWQVVRLARR